MLKQNIGQLPKWPDLRPVAVVPVWQLERLEARACRSHLFSLQVDDYILTRTSS